MSTEYINNMTVSADGRFYSPTGRECEFMRYPFTLRSVFLEEPEQITDRDDLREFLIRHKDAGASFSINDVLDWVEDQKTWSGSFRRSIHDRVCSQMLDEGCIYLG